MWVSKFKYDKLYKQNQELIKQKQQLEDSVNFFINMYGGIVEEAIENDCDFYNNRTSRLIHPSLKRLVLSGMNSLLMAIGSEKRFTLSNSYLR